jgi:hypothetical protein
LKVATFIKAEGSFPGSYIPEEIFYATGVITLYEGGNGHPSDAVLSVVPEIIHPSAPARIGAMAAKTNVSYNVVDLVVAPIACQNQKSLRTSANAGEA